MVSISRRFYSFRILNVDSSNIWNSLWFRNFELSMDGNTHYTEIVTSEFNIVFTYRSHYKDVNHMNDVS
jgi:hypothetical protein